jgi:hypothetical protein
MLEEFAAPSIDATTERNTMHEHEFALILAHAEQSDDDAERLYAEFDDGTIVTSHEVTRIEFAREAKSLEAAIRSAVADVRRAGFQVVRIEIDSPEYCAP